MTGTSSTPPTWCSAVSPPRLQSCCAARTSAPHADSGNHVIIINADKIALTGNKMGKELYSHSGRPGGLRRDSYAELLEKNPERIIKNAVKGMLPKNRLAKVQLDRLRIFRGAEHPHTPQKPQVFEIAQVSQQAK